MSVLFAREKSIIGVLIMTKKDGNAKKFILVGNPNCGKSTLFNALTGLKQPVGNFSGVTVDVCQGNVKKKFGASETVIVDVPGLYSLEGGSGDAEIAAKEVIKGEYDCIINVVDATALERHLALSLELVKLARPMVICVTFTDVLEKRGEKADWNLLSEKLGGIPVVPVDAKRSVNFKELLSAALNPGNVFYGYRIYSQQESFEIIGKLLNDVITKKRQIDTKGYLLDKIILNRFLGPALSLSGLGTMFFLTFGAPGRAATEGLACLFDLLSDKLAMCLALLKLPPWGTELICNGIVGGVGGVLVFLPQLAILYACVAVLEDCGLMARFSFLADPVFRPLGLSGKAAVPIIMGFGCTVPAIASSKLSEHPKERFMTLCLLPFLSCSARLPVYFYILGKFFPDCPDFIAILLYLPGILLGVLVSLIGGRMRFSSAKSAEKDAGDNFLLELPPYRAPSLSSVLSKTLANLVQFIKKAATIMLLLSLGVWVADRTGLMYQIGRALSPVFRPVGFGVPEAVVAVLTGFGAKEAIVSSLSVFEAEGFVITDHITRAGAVAMLCFISAYTPCVAAITALNKELGSKKITAALLVSQLVISYAAAGVVYFVFSFIF